MDVYTRHKTVATLRDELLALEGEIKYVKELRSVMADYLRSLEDRLERLVESARSLAREIERTPFTTPRSRSGSPPT